MCGITTKLSFEHVPPHSCFNDKPVYVLKGDRLLQEDFDINRPSGPQSQMGLGSYTLCERCNSDTGAWYGSAFADWSSQAARILFYTRPTPLLYYPFHFHPLRVLKQIVVMQFSANTIGFRKTYPELVKFCLNKEYHYYPKNLRVFIYYNPSSRGREAGTVGKLDIFSGRISIISEVSWFPMGYVLSQRGDVPDDRLFDITFFSECLYDKRKEMSLRINALPVYTYFPGDYRNKQDVHRDQIKNIEDARKSRRS